MDIEELKKLVSECEILLLGKKNFRMFGILSYGLNKKVVDPKDVDYPKKFKKIDSAMSLANSKEMTIVPVGDIQRSEILFSMIHQILHIISGHMIRKGEKNEIIWNMACDHVVNRILKYLENTTAQIKVPKSAVFFEDLEKKYPECSVEQLYDILMEEQQQEQQQQQQQSSGKGKGKGKGGGGSGDENEQNDDEQNKSDKQKYRIDIYIGEDNIAYIQITNQKTKETYVLIADVCLDENEEDANAFEEVSNELADKAKTLWHSNQIDKGNLPGQFCSYLEKLFKIEIPWESVLETALLYPVQIRKRRSWIEPNFYVRKPIKLPGKCQRSNDVKKLLVVIDTSGSVSDDDLGVFFGVVVDSVNYYNGLVVMQHDTVIHTVKEYSKKPSVNVLIEDMKKVNGRGGTSHRDAFEKIKERLDENTDISTILFLTDYESDIEQIYKNYDWIKENDTIWVLTTEHEVKLDGCKKSVIRISHLRDRRKR